MFCSLLTNAQNNYPKAATPEMEFVMQLNVTLGEAYTVGETQRESAMLYPLQVEHLRDRSFTALSSMVEQTTNSSVLMEIALHLRPYIQL